MASPPPATALLLLALFASNLPIASTDEKAPLDAREVIDRWAKRNPAIQSLRFRWVKVTTTAMSEPPRRDKKPVPPAPVPLEFKEILTIKGDCMRFDRLGPEYNERANAYVNEKYISSYNGNTSKVFYDLSGGTPWRVGFIAKRDKNQDCDNYHLMPMMLFSLPLSPKYSPFKDASEWRLGDAEREIQGHQCRVITNGGKSYWFDPSRGNAVVLYEVAANGVIVLRQEISYRDDPRFGPVPSRWATKAYGGNGIVLEASSVTVMNYEFNKEDNIDYFDINFPPGTEVRDDR